MVSSSPLHSVVLAAGLLLATMPGAEAAVMRGAVSASTTMGSFFGSPTQLIDQSGLQASYVSGTTDFTAFTASTLHADQSAAVSWFSTFNTPTGFLTFDLGASYILEGLALWPSNGAQASLKDFKVFVDSDADLGNGQGTEVLSASMAFFGVMTPDIVPAQTFDFQAISARYLHLQVLSNANGVGITGFSEIAFREFAQAPVPAPEPGSLALVGLAAAGLLAARRRTA